MLITIVEKIKELLLIKECLSMIMNTIVFENDVLNLPAIMIPPLMSSTMNIETIKEVGTKGTKLMD